ncbi:transposase [Ornithinibacillus halophilus]|uniref:REP element-mobilizing transposase RayT n=1 Tax=Ornithinibacillus halophilus TaxID=930117 RepID=A0A1M5GJ03_9BACI|nr:transposase [Ornithinibacillus halophilus]SHG03699.1 REP element-mobilizing transposase RayT [Ornithinibacillus halophilus]
MPRKARRKSNSGIYHIILRGANRQEIFHDDDDCIRFLEILKKYKDKTDIKVYAWCLMGNHIHLLLKEGNEAISNTMKRIGVSYVSYYNWKYRTTGHLFQDRFKSENVETDRYLLTVTRYIHQNPLKAGMVGKVEEWSWSSCLGYYGKHCFPIKLLDKELVLGMFSVDMEKAIERFRVFNEERNDDECLDEPVIKRRKTDEEARQEIKQLLGQLEIAQVKSLPRVERNSVLRRVKRIDGVSQRQVARILGVSATLVFRA